MSTKEVEILDIQRVRFKLSGNVMDYIEVVRTTKGIEVRGGDLIKVYPLAANRLRIELADIDVEGRR